jgi:non-specific serine/threonine protein kinase
LRQICDFDRKSHSSSKIDFALDLIEKIYVRKEKCVIFSFWLHPLNILKEKLDISYDEKFSMIFDGSLDKSEREEVLTRFKENEDMPILLCSGKIGGEGLNLTEANHVIFINNWWNPSNNNQARDRVVRIGQEKKAFIHNLRADDTIESRLDEILKEKDNINEVVIESLVREIKAKIKNEI